MTVSLIVGTLAPSPNYRSPGELAGPGPQPPAARPRPTDSPPASPSWSRPRAKSPLANAGPSNPYLNGVEIPTEPNLPLGLSLDVTYSDITLQLPADQLCTLVTDGVVRGHQRYHPRALWFRSHSGHQPPIRLFHRRKPRAPSASEPRKPTTSRSSPSPAQSSRGRPSHEVENLLTPVTANESCRPQHARDPLRGHRPRPRRRALRPGPSRRRSRVAPGNLGPKS